MSSTDILDRIAPGEAHLPASLRTQARALFIGGRPVLELRDPAAGSGDPGTIRHRFHLSRAGQRLVLVAE